MREEAASARSALESRLVETLVDTFSLMRSQTTVTNLYIQEIRSTLNDVKDRIDDLEKKSEAHDSKGEEILIEETRSLKDMIEMRMIALEEKILEQKNELKNSIADQATALEGHTVAFEGQTVALEGQTAALEGQMAVSTTVSQEVSETLATALTLKDRQQTWLSEVRLISLYKMSGQTS